MSDADNLPSTGLLHNGTFIDPTNQAYRAATAQVGSPSLVQHLAYRIPPDYSVLSDSPNSWLVPIQRFLDKLDERLKRKDESNPSTIEEYRPNTLLIGTDSARRYRTASLGFHWNSIPVTLTLEVHREYMTLTGVMNLSEWKLDNGRPEIVTELKDKIAAFGKMTKERSKKIAAGESDTAPDDDREAMIEPHEVLFGRIWDVFYADVLRNALDDAGQTMGELFAAGRGFVVSLDEKDPEHFILQPNHGTRTALDKPGRSFNVNEDFQLAHTVLPLLRAGEGMESMEHSVSQLDENCLYVTSLGARTSPTEPSPVATYLLLATHSNPFQLGWLVSRFNDLGTVRRAALFDLKELAAGDRVLGELESSLESKRNGREFSKDHLQGAYNLLDRAARGGVDNGEAIRGGLPYRVSQANGYWKYFVTMSDDMPIKPVDGFSNYIELTRHRIGDTYEAIAGYGDRYRVMAIRLNALSRQVQAEKLLALQDKLTEQTGRIEWLQASAEKAFWLFLFPYYSSSFALDLFSKNKEPHLSLNGKEIPAKELIMLTLFGYGVRKAYYGQWKNMAWGTTDLIRHAPTAIRTGASMSSNYLRVKITDSKNAVKAEWQKCKPLLLDPQVVSYFDRNYCDLETGKPRPISRIGNIAKPEEKRPTS